MKIKKILMGILVLSMLGLSACSSSDPPEIYERMAAYYGNVLIEKGVRIDYDRSLKISDGSKNTKYSQNGEITAKAGEDEKALSVALNGGVSIDLSVGNALNVPVKAYYRDGVLYSDINGSRLSYTMEQQDALAQLGPVCMPVTDMDVEDFKELTIKDNEDNTRTISIMISAKAARKINGLQESWQRIADIDAGDARVEFQDVRGFITIKDEMPVKQSLTIIGSIKTAERTYSVTEELVLVISGEAEVEVETPAADQYISLD